MCDAVIAEPADVPKLMPLTLENESVWNAKPPFPAVTFWFDWDVSPLCDAVTRVDPDRPKVMPFESLKTIVPLVAVCVPAAALQAPYSASRTPTP